MKLRVLLPAARARRGRLSQVSFVGITGSAGKTTTKELTVAILSRQGRMTATPGGENSPLVAARTVLGTGHRDRFCVVEVAAGFPGDVGRVASVIRPHVAAVTTIGLEHHMTFRTLDAIAAEKRRLLDHLTPEGTAVLNADNPHTSAMGDALPGRVLSFGSDSAADLQAHDIRAAWPDTLTFTLRRRGRSHAVRTGLYGRHWVPSVLAAVGIALALDVPLEQSLPALEMVPAPPGRMSPEARDGVTFVVDDLKASVWALPAAFTFLREARAERKLAVLGTLSDYPGDSSRAYRRAAAAALEVAAEVIFVGPMAHLALRRNPEAHRRLWAFDNLETAAAHLRSVLQDGDLVLLKGSRRADRLGTLLDTVRPLAAA